MTTRVLLSAVLLLAALAPASAGADGLPSGLLAGLAGVTVPASPARFVTVSMGDNTGLLRLLRNGGQVSAYRELHGRLGVPAVAMDGTPGGLSADGRTLVLVRQARRFPVRTTRMAIVDTHTLHTERIALAGEWGYDALSPDGRWLYLVEYPFANDVTRYAVRRYDVRRHRLVPGAIVDKREPGEEMRGSPLTRASSPRGRWAYTLYDGAGGAPFIHALDTERQRAFCIDLDALEGHPDLYSVRLQWAAKGLRLVDRDEELAVVDPATLQPSASQTAR
jgi:hypothetical protein